MVLHRLYVYFHEVRHERTYLRQDNSRCTAMSCILPFHAPLGLKRFDLSPLLSADLLLSPVTNYNATLNLSVDILAVTAAMNSSTRSKYSSPCSRGFWMPKYSNEFRYSSLLVPTSNLIESTEWGERKEVNGSIGMGQGRFWCDCNRDVLGQHLHHGEYAMWRNTTRRTIQRLHAKTRRCLN